MPVEFSKETRVCNLLRDYLILNEFFIVQLVFPGAQAMFSINYLSGTTDTRKNVFPDLLAIRNNNIFVGEVKARYSNADKLKLLDVKNSIDAEQRIKALITRITKIEVTYFSVRYLLIHSDLKIVEDNDIEQLVLK